MTSGFRRFIQVFPVRIFLCQHDQFIDFLVLHLMIGMGQFMNHDGWNTSDEFNKAIDIMDFNTTVFVWIKATAYDMVFLKIERNIFAGVFTQPDWYLFQTLKHIARAIHEPPHKACLRETEAHNPACWSLLSTNALSTWICQP